MLDMLNELMKDPWVWAAGWVATVASFVFGLFQFGKRKQCEQKLKSYVVVQKGNVVLGDVAGKNINKKE